jgi:hypothetical protein
MPGALDSRMRNSAFRMIRKYGKTLTYTAVTSAGYTSGSGFGSESTSDTIVIGVIQKIEANLIDGTNIQRGDLRVMIDALTLDTNSITPSQEDRMTIDSDIYKITMIEPEYSGELVAYYTFFIRKGQ